MTGRSNTSPSRRVPTFTVDGKQYGVRDLTPGMKLTQRIVTTTTPQTITTVRSVSGKVWQVSAPLSVILTLPDGTNKQFKVPKEHEVHN